MKLNFKQMIDKSGITQTRLAQLTGLSYPTINALYKGTAKSIYFDVLDKLCDILNCTPNDLIIVDNIKEKESMQLKPANDVTTDTDIVIRYVKALTEQDKKIEMKTIQDDSGDKYLVPCIRYTKKDND